MGANEDRSSPRMEWVRNGMGAERGASLRVTGVMVAATRCMAHGAGLMVLVKHVARSTGRTAPRSRKARAFTAT